VTVEADAGQVFQALIARIALSPLRIAPVADYRRTRYRPQLVDTAAPDDGSLLQSDAILRLQAYLPRRGHVLFDAGNCAASALHFLELPAGTSSTIALGMGGMGYAIAAAIGATLGGPPGEHAVVLCGDGAFLMGGMEIHAAVELGLPILFVVFNNGAHGMCVTRQQRYFDGRLECSAYDPVDVAAVVRGLAGPDRLWVGHAGTDAELDAALAAYHALPNRGPGVLELRLAREQVPPFTPFLAADAATYVVPVAAVQRQRAA
jgi:acetolactate synthase-1/2/3 large subunit